MQTIGNGGSIKSELTYYYKNGNLELFLKQLPEQELAYAEIALLLYSWQNKDDSAIVDMIIKEKRRRILNEYLDKETSDFIADQYGSLAEKIPLDDFKKSVVYCIQRDIDYAHLVKWCPAMMNIELVHKIYEHLKFYGLTDKEIFKVISTNTEKLIYFAQIVDHYKVPNPKKTEEDETFRNFVTYTANSLKASKSGTESYKKIIDYEIKKNQDVLRKLQ